MIITTESEKLYRKFRHINLSDKSKKNDIEIIKMIKDHFDKNQIMYFDVTGLLMDNQEEILAKIDNKDQYKETFESFKVAPSAIRLVHLNQIVNETGQEKFRIIRK
jgi:hypothetical protein